MQTLSVSEVNAQIKGLLEATFIQVRVSGEVSNFTRHSSGHLYFTIKDKDSILKCVMFRGNASLLKFSIEEGLDVTLEGAISVYMPRGEYQLNCARAYPNGAGALHLAFEQLKKEYAAKGYFERKRPMPRFPKKVALITSSTGFVLQDMLKVARRRWNLVEFVLLDTLVQGEGAKFSIARNIAIAETLGVDCIVLARGGGSLEDLWAFNEPMVLEAMFQVTTPLISAIGHEPDVMLSDFIADLRAPTPTAAMELLLPNQSDYLLSLDAMQETLQQQMRKILKSKETQIQQLRLSLDHNPFFNQFSLLAQRCSAQQKFLVQNMEHKLALLSLKLQTQSAQIPLTMEQVFARLHLQLESLKAQLESKNPANYQKDGYVCVLSEGKRIKKLSSIPLESWLELQDSSGAVKVQVKEVVYKV